MSYFENSIESFHFSFNKDFTQDRHEKLYKSSLQFNCFESELFETVFQSELSKEASICFLELESILATISTESSHFKIPSFVKRMKPYLLKRAFEILNEQMIDFRNEQMIDFRNEQMIDFKEFETVLKVIHSSIKHSEVIDTVNEKVTQLVKYFGFGLDFKQKICLSKMKNVSEIELNGLQQFGVKYRILLSPINQLQMKQIIDKMDSFFNFSKRLFILNTFKVALYLNVIMLVDSDVIDDEIDNDVIDNEIDSDVIDNDVIDNEADAIFKKLSTPNPLFKNSVKLSPLRILLHFEEIQDKIETVIDLKLVSSKDFDSIKYLFSFSNIFDLSPIL